MRNLYLRMIWLISLLVGSHLSGQQMMQDSPFDNGYWEHIPGLNYAVDIIAESKDALYVGGLFTDAGGDTNADYIAMWNGSEWQALGSGLNQWVHNIVVVGDNVYAGGLFTGAGGNPNADYLAKWNGIYWDTVGTRLNASVFAIAVDHDTVYAGGYFRNAGGNPEADRIAKWNGQEWEAMDHGLNNAVWAIAINNGDIYAGGSFTNASGDTAANYLAKWNAVNKKWEAFGNGLNNDVVYIDFHDGVMYIGGHFKDAGGDTTADLIARWNGKNWEGLGAGLSGHTYAGTALVQEFVFHGTDMYVSGYFSGVGEDSTYNNIAKWNGSTWEKLGTGLDQETRSLGFLGEDFYIGGSFQSDGLPGGALLMPFLARWRRTPADIVGTDQSGLPAFRLEQNYPNPFNPITTINFVLPKKRHISLKIYNLIGQEVATLANGAYAAGDHRVQWYARNLASGVYFYRLKAGDYTQTRRLVLMK